MIIMMIAGPGTASGGRAAQLDFQIQVLDSASAEPGVMPKPCREYDRPGSGGGLRPIHWQLPQSQCPRRPVPGRIIESVALACNVAVTVTVCLGDLQVQVLTRTRRDSHGPGTGRWQVGEQLGPPGRGAGILCQSTDVPPRRSMPAGYRRGGCVGH